MLDCFGPIEHRPPACLLTPPVVVVFVRAGKHDAQTHKACIDRWLERQETCPLCRRDVRDPVIEQMRQQPLNAEAQLKGCR